MDLIRVAGGKPLILARRAVSYCRRGVVIDFSFRPGGSPGDENLMYRFQSGESGAFDELFGRYRAFVFGIVYLIVKDPKISEDLTQTVFLKVWQSPLGFRDGSLAAWITRISRNCALDEIRRRRHFVGYMDVDVDDANPFKSVAAALDAQRLYAALTKISPAQRLLIELNFFKGMSHIQIAARTGIPLGTVKTRIRTGLHVLRRALHDEIACTPT